MTDPTYAVQVAVMAAIRTSASAITGVYDVVQTDPAYPYATVSTPSTVPIDEECWDRWDVLLQIDVWDDQPSSARVKQIAPLIVSALHEQDFAITGRLVDRSSVTSTVYSREEQTLINRARIMLAVETQPAT